MPRFSDQVQGRAVNICNLCLRPYLDSKISGVISYILISEIFKNQLWNQRFFMALVCFAGLVDLLKRLNLLQHLVFDFRVITDHMEEEEGELLLS